VGSASVCLYLQAIGARCVQRGVTVNGVQWNVMEEKAVRATAGVQIRWKDVFASGDGMGQRVQ
jgi:hypothetical protein